MIGFGQKMSVNQIHFLLILGFLWGSLVLEKAEAVEYLIRPRESFFSRQTLNWLDLMSKDLPKKRFRRSILVKDLFKAELTPVEFLSLNSQAHLFWIEENFSIKALENLRSEGPQCNPTYEKSWALHNDGSIGTTGFPGIPGADIHVEAIWQRGFHGSRGVRVGILDTGIDLIHPDLSHNLWLNPRENGLDKAGRQKSSNGVDDDENGYVDDFAGWNFIAQNNNPMDDSGHGSHVAGIIGAENNEKGSVGVNWEVSLVAIKMMDKKGHGNLETTLAAVDYAQRVGVDVINASWGGDPESKLLKAAIAQAEKAGILFVAAAGNDSIDNDQEPLYPASYSLDNIVSVAATDNSDRLAEFSNFGRRSVHLGAPGILIHSTVDDGGWYEFTGTSMAAPHVTGVAALLKSIHPEWDFREIKRRILNGVDPSYSLKRSTLSQGRLNAVAALDGVRSPFHDPPENRWRSYSVNLESLHPYLSAQAQAVELRHQGARFIRLHFHRIFVEEFDKIQLYDAKGALVEITPFEADNYTSEPITGDFVKIEMKPDLSLEKWGWQVDRYEVIE